MTGSYWGHVVVAVSNDRCVSAEPGGVRYRPISYYADNEEIVWSRFELTPAQRKTIQRWAVNHVRTKYNWADYYAIGFAMITKSATPARLRRWLSSTDSLQCAQLADQALQAAGIHLFKDDRVPGAVYPGSFGKHFHAMGWAHKP
ncbi:hypothetical protein [Agromyces lapidis]|uniref:Uncharacterized protein n=1 Tax=Agromyces lapidis TaxID=279574 RepID=A0ABV5SMF5_9MICO|nr:hypothetical protein [Agromyces lapidis]